MPTVAVRKGAKAQEQVYKVHDLIKSDGKAAMNDDSNPF